MDQPTALAALLCLTCRAPRRQAADRKRYDNRAAVSTLSRLVRMAGWQRLLEPWARKKAGATRGARAAAEGPLAVLSG